MAKNKYPLSPDGTPTQGWGIDRSKPACLCVDGETYSNECCEGYLWNQGIGRTQGTNPAQQNLLITEPASQGVASVFILWQDDNTNEIGKIIWST
tara:strand:+ start:9151 stop:9435 length:285 start_codon:yes stop_codon:yes gene_type:complete